MNSIFEISDKKRKLNSIIKKMPLLSFFFNKHKNKNDFCQRAVITEASSSLLLDNGPYTFVCVVGPSFNQNIPNAMMTCRMGYCNAFEELGIPYNIVDINDLKSVLPKINNPFCMILGDDYLCMDNDTLRCIEKYPKFVWVNPWFNNSKDFFDDHNLNPTIWTWSEEHINKIVNSHPEFVFTATVETGLHFFENWSNSGLKVISLPLACDTKLYTQSAPYFKSFEGIKMAFVGGYWDSKGKQIDKYLRPFENELIIYGYDVWPYRGYKGLLPRELEPSLYRQALISPTINEPTIKLLHGQINERVFKILGARGMTIVDAVPQYRELFSEDELIIPTDENDFIEKVSDLLTNPKLREQYSKKGYQAVIERHTYIHRAQQVLKELNLEILPTE